MRIKRFALKSGITMDDILKNKKVQDGGSYVQEDCKKILFLPLVESIELNIGFPEDLSEWNDYDYVLVLDEDFCQPYTPFYHYWDCSEKGEDYGYVFQFLNNVINRYNETMESMEFLEEVV